VYRSYIFTEFEDFTGIPMLENNMTKVVEKEKRGIQSIEVGGLLLSALLKHARPMALRDLAKEAEMASGKAHPYMVSFSKIGLIKQDAVTGFYSLGPMAIQLGLVSLQLLSPVREASPEAEKLAETTGHSVALSVWGNQGPTVVRLIDPIYPLHVNLRTGTVMSLADTATGRIFAAYLPKQLVKELMEEDYKRLGPDISNPLKPAKVEQMLKEVRHHRLSRSLGHPTPGVNAFSAPVFDYSGNLVMAVTLMGSSGIFDPEWSGSSAIAVTQCADQISERLGYVK
jgi:DNA-binding IclR family transcriptional regulator